MKPLRHLGVKVQFRKRIGPARIVSVLAAAGALAQIMLVAPAASALNTTPLPFSAFGAVAVDTQHGRVYVSGGRSDSRIAVLSKAGRLEKTLSGLPGASGLAFDPSYSTLYVSLSTREIAQINTSTASVRGRFSVSPFVPSGQMAYAGGRLWFGQSCGDIFKPIVHVNPDGSGIGVDGPPRYCPTFAAAPAHPEFLAVSELGLSPVDADMYRVDNGGFTLQASTSGRPFQNLQNLAFNRSATTLYGASGAPYEIQSFRVPDLVRSVSYGVGAYPRAVAAGGDSYLAAGRSGGTNTVTVYASGNPSPLRTINLPPGREIVPGGLVFAGPTTVLAVTAPSSGGGTLSVHVFTDVTASTSAAPKIVPSAADQAYVRSHLLRKADLPAGRWRVKPPSTTGSDEPDPTCAVEHYSLSALTATAGASVSYMRPGGIPSIESVGLVFISSGDAKRAFAIQSKVGFGRCLGGAIVVALRPRLPGVVIKLGPVKAVSAGPGRGFRIPLKLRSSRRRASLEEVVVFVRRERTRGTLILLRANSRWPQATLRLLVNRAVRRLKGS